MSALNDGFTQADTAPAIGIESADKHEKELMEQSLRVDEIIIVDDGSEKVPDYFILH